MTAINDYSGEHNRAITVYGWSRTVQGTPLWEEAERLGALAAKNGFSVVTGGYCGSMEAVSKGAREVIAAGGTGPEALQGPPEVVGVTVPTLFPDRQTEGNRYLTKTVEATSLMNRVDHLTAMSRYYVALPGTLGTLQELTCIWVLKLLHPKNLDSPLIIAYRKPWEECLQGIVASLQLPSDNFSLVQFVDTAEEAMELIVKDEAARKAQSSAVKAA